MCPCPWQGTERDELYGPSQPNTFCEVNVALGGLCVVLLATSPFPNISKDSMILECSTFGASRSQKGSETPIMVETRSWKDYSWLPKPLRCSHEERYQYDTAVGTCREELTNATSTGADTSLQQVKASSSERVLGRKSTPRARWGEPLMQSRSALPAWVSPTLLSLLTGSRAAFPGSSKSAK